MALVSILAPDAERRVTGSLAVCFADGQRSCAAGSFSAQPCPATIDAPVRSDAPLEAIPKEYADRMRDGGSP